MYCYGSTISCTRFPKFFAEGKPQILPRPQLSSKPNHKGYKIVRSSWMCSFIKEVEHHVLHFLHNICKDKVFKKMTLFNIELTRKIIPECLCLGDSFFYPYDHIWYYFQRGWSLTTLDHRQWTLAGRYIMCHLIMELCRYDSSTGFYMEQMSRKARDVVSNSISRKMCLYISSYMVLFYDKYCLTGYPQGPIIFSYVH